MTNKPIPKMKQIWVPSKFWDDHEERCPCDDPDTQIAEVIKRARNRVLIRGTLDQIETLRADAEFYCSVDAPDQCPPGLVTSAVRTLNAIAKAEGKS